MISVLITALITHRHELNGTRLLEPKGAFTLPAVWRRAARHQTAKSKRERLEQQNRRRTPYGALLLSLCTFTSTARRRAVLRRAAPMERRQELLCCAVRRAV